MELNDKNKKTLLGVLAVIAIIMIALVIKTCSGKGDQATTKEKVTESAKTQVTEEVTATPVNRSLQKNADEKINTLVKDFLTARKEANVDKLKNIVSTGEEMDKSAYQKKYEYVEKIQDIDCYTLPGVEENTYIVYAYYNMKFINIDTLAPGLEQLYITLTSEGTYVIMLDELGEEVEKAREDALQREDVKNLINMVNTNFANAINKDGELKKMVVKFNSVETQGTKKPAATKAPEATKAPATPTN